MFLKCAKKVCVFTRSASFVRRTCFFVFQHVIKTMSRTKRTLPKNSFCFRPVSGKKQQNAQIEIAQELNIDKGAKIQPYSGDDFKLSAWKENVKLDWIVEEGGTTSYYLHGRFMVNLSKEEEETFPFQQFFGEYAEHLA